MIRFRFVFSFIAVLLLMAAPISDAYATPASAAGNYIEKLGEQALAIISNTSLSKDQKQANLEGLFSQNVDIPWVGRFVMGRFWKQATDDQKARYIKAYEKFIIMHYSERFTQYTSGTFKVTDSKDNGDNEYLVNMQIQSTDNNSEPVMVDYRVRKETDSSFKVIDVIVEGVSMITTQRSEFAAVITDHNIDFLIDQLANRSIVINDK